jgi:septation ring formation regulator EzrA
MNLNEHVLKLCEELFEKLSPSELKKNQAARTFIGKLSDYLSTVAENVSEENEPKLLREIYEDVTQIHELISEEEKCANQKYMKQFDELTEHLNYLYAEMTGQEDGFSAEMENVDDEESDLEDEDELDGFESYDESDEEDESWD